MTDMTTREMLNSVIANEITDEVIEKAKMCLEALDKRNAQRKSKPSKTTEENKVVRVNIANFLTDKDFTLSSEIAEGLELSVNKVSSLCTRMVSEGILQSTEVKVKGGKRKAYKLA